MKARLFNIREADEALHAVFTEWWKAHEWPGVSLAILPKCGVLIEDETTKYAAAWLYMDNSTGVSMMEWTVTNPAISAKQSYQAIAVLVGAIREVAKSLDYGVVLTTAKQHSLARMYERQGFQQTDTGMTHLIMTTGLQKG